jgi:thiol-disulfide isomerase/thioredoxin
MNQIVRFLLVELVFLTVAVSPVGSAEVGELLPDFSVRTFGGATLSSSALKGRPLLLVFWNTWCPDCMRELPKINRLAEKFVPRGLAVLAINSAINDGERRARAYWAKERFKFPSGFDHDFTIGDAFGIRGVPTIFLIDSKGVIRYKQSRLPEDIEERLRVLFGTTRVSRRIAISTMSSIY